MILVLSYKFFFLMLFVFSLFHGFGYSFSIFPSETKYIQVPFFGMHCPKILLHKTPEHDTLNYCCCFLSGIKRLLKRCSPPHSVRYTEYLQEFEHSTIWFEQIDNINTIATRYTHAHGNSHALPCPSLRQAGTRPL